MRRAAIAGVVAAAVAGSAPAPAQEEPCRVVVIVLEEASLPALLEAPALRSLAAAGGAALMNGRADVYRTFAIFDTPQADPTRLPGLCRDHPEPFAEPEDAAKLLVDGRARFADRSLLMVVSALPSAASAADGDELGAVIAAWGDPDELLEADGEPRALTSDSTRRAGVVATVDPAATVAAWLALPHDAGAPIEPTDEPAPLDLYERYLQQRRLAVPVAATSWIGLGIAAIGATLLIRARDRVGGGWLRAAAVSAAAFPWLALALLLVGHLPSLTVWTVLAFVPAATAAGAAFTTWATDRWGALRALAVTGVAILAILLAEALAGWPAAMTPLAGGGQLDGGRFFGMPNAEIGLVLGAALYGAQRLGTAPGAALLAACGLVVGSPWTGANAGAAITLFAATGLWLGIRGGRRWWVTSAVTLATVAVGMAVVGVMHRYLTERPTHVASFLGSGGLPAEAVDRLVDRLGIGAELIADSPFALVPVVGTLVLLALVLRPPTSRAATFAASDAWRDAALVLVLGSIVAYVANDTGAAALGFGFVLALAAMLHVSAATAREKIGR